MSLILPDEMIKYLQAPLFSSYLLFQANQRSSLFLLSERNKIATLIARTKQALANCPSSTTHLSLYIPWLSSLYENVYEFWVFCIYQRKLAELCFSSSNPTSAYYSSRLDLDHVLTSNVNHDVSPACTPPTISTPPPSPSALIRHPALHGAKLLEVFSTPARLLGPLRLYNYDPDKDF
jgi:hypothetical protein